MQDGIQPVELWGTKWGFKFSVEKKQKFFTGNKISDGQDLKLFLSSCGVTEIHIRGTMKYRYI